MRTSQCFYMSTTVRCQNRTHVIPATALCFICSGPWSTSVDTPSEEECSRGVQRATFASSPLQLRAVVLCFTVSSMCIIALFQYVLLMFHLDN